MEITNTAVFCYTTDTWLCGRKWLVSLFWTTTMCTHADSYNKTLGVSCHQPVKNALYLIFLLYFPVCWPETLSVTALLQFCSLLLTLLFSVLLVMWPVICNILFMTDTTPQI